MSFIHDSSAVKLLQAKVVECLITEDIVSFESFLTTNDSSQGLLTSAVFKQARSLLHQIVLWSRHGSQRIVTVTDSKVTGPQCHCCPHGVHGDAEAVSIRMMRVLLADSRVDETLIDLIDSDGMTAFMHAAQLGDAAMVGLFLADARLTKHAIDRRARCGRTALMYAAESGHVHVVELLLAESDGRIDKTSIDFADCFGDAAFICTVRNGFVAIVQMLLADARIDKASLHHRDCSGRTSLVHAAANGHTSIVELLLADTRHMDKASVDTPCEHGRTALMYACTNGHISIVKLLLADSRIDSTSVNRANLDGWTALFFAVMGGHTSIVELLLADKRVDKTSLEHQADFGRTLLTISASSGHTDTMKALLADPRMDKTFIDNADFYGDTALICAVKDGFPAIVQVLLDDDRVDQVTLGNARPGSNNGMTMSALMQAAIGNHMSVVKLLLSHHKTTFDSIVHVLQHYSTSWLSDNTVLCMTTELTRRQMCVIYPSKCRPLQQNLIQFEMELLQVQRDILPLESDSDTINVAATNAIESDCALVRSFFNSSILDVNVLRIIRRYLS
jgi:ankyrin repeat protein